MARNWKVWSFILISFLVLGCAAKKSGEDASITGSETDLTASAALELDEFMEEKVDNFLVILDASGAKYRPYKGKVKLRIAKDLLSRFNQDVPERKLTAGLRRYGFEAGAFSIPTEMIYGLGDYDRKAYADSLETIRWAGGKSPLPLAVNEGTEDLKPTKGYIATVIFSDGKINEKDPLLAEVLSEMDDNPALAQKYQALSRSPILDTIIMEMESDSALSERALKMSRQILDAKNNPERLEQIMKRDPALSEKFREIDGDPQIAAGIMVMAAKIPFSKTLQAARHMKATYGDRICIYTVQIGDHPYGKNLLQQVARAGGCGYSVTSDYLASDRNMADFVHDVFNRGKPRLARMAEERGRKPADCIDRDNDGICDDVDDCPDTPIGAPVDDRGCWVIDNIQFDLNKWNIKPRYRAILDEVASVLIRNPELKMGVYGHTCTIWTERYNMKLSNWRSLSAASYLLNKGVKSEQLTVKGFGFHQPLASNKTEEGRILNRRVEFHPFR